MPTVARRLLVALLLLLVLLAVGLVLLVALVDLNRFKPTIEARVAALTGRELTIGGEIGWSFYPVLGAELREVTLGNAPGFAGPMAQIERAALGVALMPLLRGELRVSEVVLEQPRLALAVDAAGRNNWEDLQAALAGDESTATDTPPTDDNQEPLAVAIEGVRISAGAVSWDDASTGSQLRLDALSLRTGAVGSGAPIPVELALELASGEPPLRVAPLRLTAEVDVTPDFSRIGWRGLDLSATLHQGATEVPLRLTGDGSVDLNAQQLQLPALVLASGDLTLKASVEGQQIVDAPRFAGQLDIAPFALRPLFTQLDIALPATTDPQVLSQLALSGRFEATPESIALNELQARLDDTTLSGQLAAQLGDVTALTFALAVDQLDIDRYLPPAEEEAASAPPSQAGKTAQPPAGPAAADPFGWMDGLALDGTLKAGQLTVAQLTLREVAATLRLRDRIFTADPVRAQLYGGEQQVALRLDARGAEPATQLKIDLNHVALETLLDDLMDKAPLRGTAALTADLRLRGLEADRIKQTLSGNGQLIVRDGAVKGFNLAQELRNAMALLQGQPRSQAVAETDFTELTLPFTATDGVVSWPALAAQSPLLRLGSRGSLDLSRDRLDAHIDASVVKSLQGQGGEPLSELAGFNIPVTLRGSLAEPKVGVDIKGVLAQTKLGGKQAELEQKVEERKEELRGKAAEELQRGLNRLFKSRDAAPADAGTAPATGGQ